MLSGFSVHEYNMELLVRLVHPWKLSHPPPRDSDYVRGKPRELTLNMYTRENLKQDVCRHYFGNTHRED